MPLTRIFPRQAGQSKIVMLLIVLNVAAIAAAAAAVFYLAHVIDSRMVAEGAGVADGSAVPAQPQPPIYVSLEPPLVVNFDRNGRIGYLQAEIQLMTREPRVQEALQQHAPAIRNNLLLLFSSKSYAEVAGRDGKERLRHEAMQEVNRMLFERGVPGHVEELYFTGFVMQ